MNKTTLIAIIAIIILAGGYFLIQKSQTAPTTGLESSSAIQNDSDLTLASQDLDATDVNIIDGTLSQNDADSASF